MRGGLVILHVDGLSHSELEAALGRGDLPYLQALMEREGYEALPYWSGIPSTTPHVQAGILYGDDRDICGFRWWDRQAGTLIQFGAEGNFKQVAHRHFRGTRPLCEEGASIAACYPAGAAETFGLTYRDRSYHGRRGDRGAWSVLAPWAANPLHLADLLGHGGQAVAMTALAALGARAAGRRPVRTYVVGDMLEEILLHHQTRYAAVRAMHDGYPAIYAAFYAYDETGHGFGPDDPYTRRMLRHVDHSIREVAEARRANDSGTAFELVVLSDHGQVPTRPHREVAGVTLGEVISHRLPGARVEEFHGRRFGPGAGWQTRVVVVYSGGLAHVYFADFPERLRRSEVDRRFPGIAEALAATPGVAMVLAREGDATTYLPSPAPLESFGDPDRLRRQLDRLLASDACGDLVVVAGWADAARRRQVNFEEQAGGHGSIGGEQDRPFLLVKREWGIDVAGVEDAAGLHEILWGLRRRATGAAGG